jgi:putative ABC transport system permease protein
MFVAVPIGRALSDAVGRTFMESPLDFTYPWNAVLLWFVLVIALATVSSALPAWNATRVSVREVLAYE